MSFLSRKREKLAQSQKAIQDQEAILIRLTRVETQIRALQLKTNIKPAPRREAG